MYKYRPNNDGLIVHVVDEQINGIVIIFTYIAKKLKYKSNQNC